MVDTWIGFVGGADKTEVDPLDTSNNVSSTNISKRKTLQKAGWAKLLYYLHISKKRARFTACSVNLALMCHWDYDLTTFFEVITSLELMEGVNAVAISAAILSRTAKRFR